MAERLDGMPWFADLDPRPLHAELAALWNRERDGLIGANESQTEERFIKPCLRALGFEYTVQSDLRFAGRRRQPDYALFLDQEARRAADLVEDRARYAAAVAVLDAKRFDRPLDAARDGGALSADPVAQIITYIRRARGFRERVQPEWRSSVAALADLRRAQAADELELDRLVFDLYGLPEALVRVVDAEYE